MMYNTNINVNDVIYVCLSFNYFDYFVFLACKNFWILFFNGSCWLQAKVFYYELMHLGHHIKIEVIIVSLCHYFSLLVLCNILVFMLHLGFKNLQFIQNYVGLDMSMHITTKYNHEFWMPLLMYVYNNLTWTSITIESIRVNASYSGPLLVSQW